MKLHPFSAPLPILFLLLGSTTLPLLSCASHSRGRTAMRTAVYATGRHEQTGRNDSLDRRRRICYTSPLAASHARLQFPPGSLGPLPRGAAYVRKEGQASAIVHFQHDTLYIEALCDSLQRVAYTYEEEIRRLESRSASEETQTAGAGGHNESRTRVTSRWWLWTALGIALGCFFRFRK